MNGQHDLDAVPELEPYKAKLNSLGYSTYEEFYYVAEVASPELAEFLGVASVNTIIDTITSVDATTIAESDLEIILGAVYALGVDIDNVPRPGIAPPISGATTLPVSIDLRNDLPEIRNQEKRGTCVAHATLAAYEHFLMTQGSYYDLSEQFLYWNCKANDGIPNMEGTFLQTAFPLLVRDGCC